MNVRLMVADLTGLGAAEMLLAVVRLHRGDAIFRQAFEVACEAVLTDGLETVFPDGIPYEFQEEAVRTAIKNLRNLLEKCLAEIGQADE